MFYKIPARKREGFCRFSSVATADLRAMPSREPRGILSIPKERDTVSIPLFWAARHQPNLNFLCIKNILGY